MIIESIISTATYLASFFFLVQADISDAHESGLGSCTPLTTRASLKRPALVDCPQILHRRGLCTQCSLEQPPSGLPRFSRELRKSSLQRPPYNCNVVLFGGAEWSSKLGASNLGKSILIPDPSFRR
ncbi:hypothetical protein VKT23_000356 [Stygiomarasmius scandens]|uniref:Secreted protein n=1 Tax=Marasmiellus scandens TaxID=2682957 RepID=A0ABR1K784_9AGAR